MSNDEQEVDDAQQLTDRVFANPSVQEAVEAYVEECRRRDA